MSERAAIEDQAAEWLARSEAPGWSDADATALQAWLAESTHHKAAYWRLEAAWRAADRIGSLGLAPAPPRLPARRRWQPIALAASIALIVSIGGLLIGKHRLAEQPAASEQLFATHVGGHRKVGLADGSRIELNTRTRLRTIVSDTRRDVWLDAGEAFFEVAHKDGEPFVVHAGPKTVTVLGTKFSVRRDGDTVTVSVLEGRVRVADAAPQPDPRSAVITKGDVAISTGSSTLLKTRSDERVEAVLAWRAGMLSFDDTRLEDVAREFNRYNTRPLVITDAETREFRVGGSFQAENVEAFAKLLRDSYGLKVEMTPEAIRVGS